MAQVRRVKVSTLVTSTNGREVTAQTLPAGAADRLWGALKTVNTGLKQWVSEGAQDPTSNKNKDTET